jgi:hypothetical protein
MFHIFLLILKCYGDCWFTTWYRIRQIVNEINSEVKNAHIPQQYRHKNSNQNLLQIATAESIKIIITTIVNNSLWNMQTVSVACTTLAAVKVDKQTVTFLIIGSYDLNSTYGLDRGLQLELNLWNTVCHMVQVDHPTYTIRCRQEYQCSELWCDCDIRCWSGTLLWRRADWRHLLLVSSVKQVCLLSRPWSIAVGPAKNSSLRLFHTS